MQFNHIPLAIFGDSMYGFTAELCNQLSSVTYQTINIKTGILILFCCLHLFLAYLKEFWFGDQNDNSLSLLGVKRLILLSFSLIKRFSTTTLITVLIEFYIFFLPEIE